MTLKFWRLPILALLAATSLYAAAIEGGALRSLAPGEAGFWHPAKEKSYMENWQLQMQADDGSFFFAVFMVSNQGLFDLNPGLAVAYYPANESRVYGNEMRIDNKQFHAATDRFDVRIGNARFWREEGRYRLKVNEGKVHADITMTPTVPTWMRDTGRMLLGSPKHSWNWIMAAPRGRATGSVTADGQTFPISGGGFVDQYWSNKSYFTFSKRWLSLHLTTAKRTINFQEIAKTKRFGAGVERSLMMAVDGQPALDTDEVEVQVLGWRQTKKYRHPTAYTLHGRIGDADVTVEASNGRYGQVIDPLASCSFIEQKIVRLLVTDPMLYRLIVDAKVRIERNGEIEVDEGKAISNMVFFEQ